MKRLMPQEVIRSKAQELGLNPERGHSLISTEGLACALRRAAGYLSPCSAATLVRAVADPLEGLVGDVQTVRERITDVLEALVGNGDLLEQKDIGVPPEAAGMLLYAAPPSFVARQSGSVLVLGIAPDHRSPLPSDLEGRLEHAGYVRRLYAPELGSLRDVLREYGLTELTSDYWMKAPLVMSAEQYLNAMDTALSKTATFGSEAQGFTLLDADRPADYYKGRWVEPKLQSGRYVSRRPQAYGADLWCYAEVSSGRLVRLVDLPIGASRHRGCDIAWHLQMAIDTVRGHPQRYSVQTETTDVRVIRFFSPIPQWAQRRLNAIGTPLEPKGCLIAYAVAAAEIEEERTFLRDALWLSEGSHG